MSNSKKIRIAVGVAIVLALTAALMFGCKVQTPPPDDDQKPSAPIDVNIDLSTLSITPCTSGESGISPDKGFLITGENAARWKEKELRAAIQAEPDFSYSLEKQDDSWFLSPVEPLERNCIYRFQAIGGDGKAVQSFAFQTESDLLVNSAYPSQDSNYVDLDSGIEISFNTTGISADHFKEHFTIQPAVSGEFRITDYTGLFIPSEPLQEDTYYHITVSAGLKASNGMELKEDYAYSFGTVTNKKDRIRFYSSGKNFETYMPGDNVYFFVHTSDETAALDFQISAYRFPDYQAYVDEIDKYNNYSTTRWGPKQEYCTDTNALKCAYQETQNLVYSRSSQHYAAIPGGLEPGFYVMTVQNNENEIHTQKYFQVCSLSVYMESASGNTLVWVNDPDTGKPLENMEISFRDIKGKLPSASGKTNTDGIARIETGELSQASVTIQKESSPIYYTLDYLQEKTEVPLSEDYFLAVYTDREIYQPTDTIHFWGVVAPRNPSGKSPNSVTASLIDNDKPFSKMTVQVGENGTFTGKLSIDGLEQSYYQFAILDENAKSYGYHYLNITEFTKPSYILDISHSKPFYFVNEPIDFSINAKYFDGSPVSGGKVSVSANGSASLTLDETGTAEYSCYYKPYGYEPIPAWYPATLWYTIGSGDERDVYMSTDGSVKIIESKIGIKTENDDNFLTVHANYLDEVKLGKDPSLDYGEVYTGPMADIPLRIVVNKITYIKKPSSTYYDPILKKNVTIYDTEREESVADILQSQTIGGTAKIPISNYTNTENVQYWYQIEFDGGVIGTVRGVHHPAQTRFWSDDEYTYSFRPDYDRLSLKQDEKIPLALYLNQTKTENKGRILYNVYQRDMLSSAFLDAGISETSLTFTQEYIPSVQITGAYFDGRKVFPIDSFSAYFNYEDKAIQVDVSSDREIYRPGEKANITVKTSVPNVSVCVGVVDESIFQIEQQNLDIVQQLYKNIYFPSVYQNASYIAYDETADSKNTATGGLGGADGGNNGYMRENFLDTALFQTAKTDENGTASVTLTLPDNITSWRITAAAVTGDLMGGSNTSNTIVTQPFYLQTIVTDEYLTGDDISVSAMGVGTEASHGEEIQYTALLKSSDGTVLNTLEAKGNAGAQTPFNFGKRPIGEYLLEVSAKLGEHTDAMRQPFSVVSSVQTEPVFQDVPFEQISSLESVRYPVRVTVYNTLLRPYLTVLNHLMYCHSDRTEELAASYEARKLYNLLLPAEEREEIYKDNRLDNIQEWESGIKILPNSEPDPAATVKMLIAAPNLINSSSSEKYFRSILADPAVAQEQRIYAYLGLSILEQPILRDIQRMASEEHTAFEKLLLGAALASFGDINGASQILDSMSNLRKEENGLIWYEGASQEESLQNTSGALLLVSLAKTRKDADGLALWLVQQTELGNLADTPISLELLSYLNGFEFDGLPESKFTYMQDGELQEVVLDANGTKTISFYKDTLEKADFKAVSGDIAANVRTVNYSSGLSTAGENLVQVSKQYYPVYANSQGFSAGQRIRVECTITFSPDAPDGNYTFSDYIPSGMRYLPDQRGYRNSSGDKECSGFVRNEGQKMNGYVGLYRPKEKPPVMPLDNPTEPVAREEVMDDSDRNPNTSSTKPYDPQKKDRTSANGSYTYTIVYYVSNTLPGEFQTEKAVVSSEEYNIRVESTPGTVVIRNR